MAPPAQVSWLAFALGALLWFASVVVPVEAAIAYCSSENTGSNFQAMNWDWQSNGWCTNACNTAGTYAYAIILSKSCWCSNYTPRDQEDLNKCSVPCPGFPSDNCGNPDQNLYIYLSLGNAPSADPTTSKPLSVKNSQPSVAVSTSSSSSAAPSTTNNVELPVSVRIITQSGLVVTQTVIPTGAPAAGNRPNSVGPIVGGVVGGIAGIAMIIGGILLFLRRRREVSQEEHGQEQGGVQRKTSTMSRSGLLFNEKGPRNPPPIVVSPESRDGEAEPGSPSSALERRGSRHLIDQRLNPQVLFTFENTSRGSVATFDDSRDYHRPLNVRNPDIE